MTNPYAPWKNARSLTDLGQLTAQWLEGTITALPAYFGSAPDPETLPLVPTLVVACRAGYVTTNSQPGQPLDDGHAQRAWVTGFSTEATADKIKAAMLGTDLVIVTTPPGWHSPTRIVVTIDDDDEFTWDGALDPESIDGDYSEDCPNALDALAGAWQISIIDPVWGRTDLLWERLAVALGAE